MKLTYKRERPAHVGPTNGTNVVVRWNPSAVREVVAIERQREVEVKLTVAFDRTVGRPLYRVHVRLYRLTHGLIGHKSPVGPMLLMTVTGRKTGQPRSVTLLYYAARGTYYVVGSNGGRPESPTWLLNVRANGHVHVQAGATHFDALARELSPEERALVWPELTNFYPGWAHYETLTDRAISVIALEPIATTNAA
jgi:deazaflavin-dependent oxidoreductase (nitroreductase family)